MAQKIVEDELGKMQELDVLVQLIVESGDLQEFNKACQEHGRQAVIGFIYANYKAHYGGPLRATSMIRRSPFYDESSF